MGLLSRARSALQSWGALPIPKAPDADVPPAATALGPAFRRSPYGRGGADNLSTVLRAQEAVLDAVLVAAHHAVQVWRAVDPVIRAAMPALDGALAGLEVAVRDTVADLQGEDRTGATREPAHPDGGPA